jgi:Flp pilus assembly pilin Flp
MAVRTKGGLLAGPLSVRSRSREKTTTMMRHAVDSLLKRPVLGNESGQDLLEYALLASLIAVAVVGAVTTVGGQINTVLWSYISGVINAI